MTDIQKENKSGGKVPNRGGSVNFPRLRFPEFEGEWESKPLREVVKINQGLQIAISERSTENKTGSYFYITNEFLKAGSGKKYYILNPPQSVICTEKDILMTRTGNTGQVVTNVSGAFHNNFFKVAYPEYIDKIFLYNFLKLNKTQNQILRFAGTSTIPDLNHSDFYRIVISFPSNIEQEKISSFLSMIDERIQAQSKIINDLKTLKTATAKKIFSQELRFKDDKGNEFLEWENILLGDTLDYEQPTNYLVSSTEYDDSFETPVVTAGKTFILGYTDDKNGVFEKEKLPVIIFDDFTTASQFVDFPFKAKSSAMKILKAKNDTNIRFIFEALQMINYEVGGHGRHWISVFSNLSIFVPSFPEQTKIANFLSAIDSKIDMENQLLQKLEEQKKYLLQNMFV
ncbi:restriction endonuclease subunit S [Elizabethkingia anophelis]|nr:restriction endonuclease subunit S [Elizabethkingia anophelis]MCT3633653.1 restriction endonuclease subunit S [Elizabethkingia anophelis]MCT3830414.1 restriction endonuclease subunit S [Elizabethkingia anophelis]MCT3883857.1 restriction endonuclease subunit S [Elizabethkingia anophelis]MCT3894625.1 restriction endonuclease subunit S [Elizabethkingia anophelis]